MHRLGSEVPSPQSTVARRADAHPVSVNRAWTLTSLSTLTGVPRAFDSSGSMSGDRLRAVTLKVVVAVAPVVSVAVTSTAYVPAAPKVCEMRLPATGSPQLIGLSGPTRHGLHVTLQASVSKRHE